MNIAFAGFRHGHIYGLYDKVVNSDRVNLIGCFEENEKAKEQAKSLRPIDFNYSSYEEILHDKNVDIVAVGDYYGKRGKLIIEALKNGKHVICDKPICTSLKELKIIKKLSEKNNLKIMCMLDMRYDIHVNKAIEIISSGQLGKLINISFTGQHCLDYGNRPEWYYEDGKHGGTINDIAIHGIDVIRYMTGKNLTKVNCAKTWNGFATNEPQFKDCGQFMVEMDDVSVMADVSYAAPKCNSTLPTYWDFYFWGTEGMMNFRSSEKVIHLYKSTAETVECEAPTSDYLEDFLDEIDGKSLRFDTQETLESQRQVLLIQKPCGK